MPDHPHPPALYLPVAHDTPRVAHFERQTDASWRLRSFHLAQDTIPLAGLAAQITLAGIYARVEFLQGD